MKNLATWLLAAAFTTAALPAFAVEPESMKNLGAAIE